MKATRPVSINGIEFDALISESRTLEATVPEYSVEDGFSVSDAVILSAETLSMVLYVTDTPVTWRDRHRSKADRVSDICNRLVQLYYKREPVKIITSDGTYSDMTITNIELSKSLETGYAREIPISFKKIRTAVSQKTTIPASYGRSGATGSSAGTAGTSSGSSSSSSSGSGGSSSSGSGNGGGSSTLYSIGSSMGLF